MYNTCLARGNPKRMLQETLARCNGTSIHLLTPPTSSSPYPHQYVFPITPVYIWLPCDHSNLLTMVNMSGQYFNTEQLGQFYHKWPWYLTTTITHIGIGPCDPMAPCNGWWTSIFGRLGTRRLGIVISTISSVAWPSQGSLECSLWISLG
jgi:hypothetical protein